MRHTSRRTRRGFIRQLLLANEAVVPTAGERTLVCIFLRGAADTLNMVVPYGDDQYYKSRPTLALPPPSQNKENDVTSIRLDDFYAFHPKLRPLVPTFEEGRLGIVQAVGTDNPTGSHFEAQDQMEHGESYGRVIGGGWLGRYLRARAAAELTPLSAVAIGSTIPESLRGAPTASAIESIDEVQIKTPLGNTAAVSSVLSTMYGAEIGFLSQPGKSTLELLKRVETLRGTSYKPEGGAVYPDDSFAQGLKEVARLVKASVGLEVACLDLGNWDTHFFQGSSSGLQADLIWQLANGLAAFDADMLSCRGRVTTIVMTEFGRRIYENGSLGTDHGRGFAMLAMGHCIRGGKVHGKWPGLAEEEAPGSTTLNNIAGPSGLKVLFDYRSVLSEVLTKILGLRDVNQVFPNFTPEHVGLVS
ncbi:MAG: DUF1501 domain-containing protein [Pyrinomonadaceae bacterium]|nr:DUF1501 domain-containing protein [Pyrinomonadaceae bacterium]